jgi:hypothetical protein
MDVAKARDHVYLRRTSRNQSHCSGIGPRLRTGDLGALASPRRRRTDSEWRHRHRSDSIRSAAGGARQLSVDDGRAVRATKGVAAGGSDRSPLAFQDSCRGLRGVRDENRAARSRRLDPSIPGRSRPRTTKPVARDVPSIARYDPRSTFPYRALSTTSRPPMVHLRRRPEHSGAHPLRKGRCP